MEAILMKIYEYYTGEERNMLLHAYDYAKAAHANQKRASGEPYFIHPCAVAEILVDLGLRSRDHCGGAFARRHRRYARHRRGHPPRIRRGSLIPRRGRHQAR